METELYRSWIARRDLVSCEINYEAFRRALPLHKHASVKSLEICHSGDEWYVTLDGTFVVGFIGTEAEQCAREQLSQLKRMLDLHRDVSTVSTDEGVNRRPPVA